VSQAPGERQLRLTRRGIGTRIDPDQGCDSREVIRGCNPDPPVTPVLRRLAAVLFLVGSLMSVAAAQPERPPPGAVIDEVARYTGLANDAVSLALKDNAAALGRLTDAVLAVQIAQRFLDAREAEIAADVLASATDTAAEALLPPPMMTAIKAVRLYKSMLEAARDKIVIPALDRQLYSVYRAEREQNQDMVNAFSFATSQSLGGGYFSVQPKMVEEYIASYKDWNPDLIGEPMRRRAERQVDRFWMARFEATYQQEKARPQQEAILAAIWGSVRDIIDQLKGVLVGVTAFELNQSTQVHHPLACAIKDEHVTCSGRYSQGEGAFITTTLTGTVSGNTLNVDNLTVFEAPTGCTSRAEYRGHDKFVLDRGGRAAINGSYTATQTLRGSPCPKGPTTWSLNYSGAGSWQMK
jgi:hypothetical protein